MPVVPVPTARQLNWQQKEFGMFCHFGINTFFGKEWSDGTLPAAGFNPTALDARQWVATAVEAGMQYMVLTAKHHDGFCLWPTETTEYSVKNSPYKNGFGDVVKEFAEACAAASMPMGLYLSPWDRHEPCYVDKDAYDKFYLQQLTELCTQYGEIFELWFDGAGSEGRTYDWNAIMEVIDTQQPQAVVFNLGRPTIRWVGNEDGLAADPNHYVVDRLSVSAFTAGLEHLHKAEHRYLPPECDVAIRQNWFWQADDLATLKTLDQLLAIYYRSVGFGANLLLNVPPDQRGLLAEEDRSRLLEMTSELKRRFANPHAATLTKTATGFLADFGKPVTFDHLCLQEDIAQGQHIVDYQICAADTTEVLVAGHTVGHKKIAACKTTTAEKLNLTLTTPPAILRSLTVYQTGHTRIPEPGAKIDYEDWEKKADKR